MKKRDQLFPPFLAIWRQVWRKIADLDFLNRRFSRGIENFIFNFAEGGNFVFRVFPFWKWPTKFGGQKPETLKSFGSLCSPGPLYPGFSPRKKIKSYLSFLEKSLSIDRIEVKRRVSLHWNGKTGCKGPNLVKMLILVIFDKMVFLESTSPTNLGETKTCNVSGITPKNGRKIGHFLEPF